MKTRKGSADEDPVDDGLTNWLHDLVDGESTARRLRRRLDATGERPDGSACSACDGAATGKFYFGVDGHLHGRRSAHQLSA